MNRIFKVIFSKTLGINVVVGETARSHGKKSLKALVAVAMMAGAMGMAGNAVALERGDFSDQPQSAEKPFEVPADSTPYDYVYGKYDAPQSGDATASEANITLGSEVTVTGSVYGGFANGVSATAYKNTLIADTVKLGDDVAVAGGYASGGTASASNNKATLTGVTTNSAIEIDGGYASGSNDASADGNTLSVIGTGTDTALFSRGSGGDAAGGVSATASENKLSISKITVINDVYGGYANASSSTAENNTVTLQNVIVKGMVYGGYANGVAVNTSNII